MRASNWAISSRSARICSLASSPDGTILASGGVGQTVKLWATPNDHGDKNTTAAQIRLWATPDD